MSQGAATGTWARRSRGLGLRKYTDTSTRPTDACSCRCLLLVGLLPLHVEGERLSRESPGSHPQPQLPAS